MRKVFDNDGVANAWAARSQPSGRSHNGNFSFDGVKLYSYSTCIASQVQAKGEWVKLFTFHTYSVTTTGKHMGPARRYAMGYCFVVPNVTMHGGAHEENRAHLIAVYTSLRDRYKRQLNPWQSMPEWLRESAEKADLYCHLFDLPETDLDADSDIVEIGHYHAARDKIRNSPAGIARRKYGRIYRAWKKLVAYRKQHSERGDDDDSQSDWTELGWMAWHTGYDNDPEILALIKWRFRKE